MRDLASFRDAVEQYCKRVGRTQKDLAAALYLTEGDLNKRLHDYSHQPSRRTWRLKPEHVMQIVETLARWGAITARKQAFALFTLIDFPALAEEIDWQAAPWNKLHLDAPQMERQPSPPEAAILPSSSTPTTPSTLYIAHQYVLMETRTFIGRQTELDMLTDWVATPDADLYSARILSIVSIGGMGKSALTWKWFNDIAPFKMNPLKARIWWSFYETDATFENFITYALACIKQQATRDIQGIPDSEKETMLLELLDKEPYLIVFDGLERILTAYANISAIYQDGTAPLRYCWRIARAGSEENVRY